MTFLNNLPPSAIEPVDREGDDNSDDDDMEWVMEALRSQVARARRCDERSFSRRRRSQQQVQQRQQQSRLEEEQASAAASGGSSGNGGVGGGSASSSKDAAGSRRQHREEEEEEEEKMTYRVVGVQLEPHGAFYVPVQPLPERDPRNYNSV
mmetsp:Transcript_2699/g.4843  ORF Transcript_2699/g.4843 Transcript_2699/m.4843 type:complete len:151 (-) Transcript_2699:283-735(-)|eukprot:CAMPEP_0197451150 /NCGR_PEP_ID=MMETSP1175-20131217/27877_1 /TAXON_ID=1003142 /ORGANISM="Triceratium dubium, Strain CCMP147" /LENGTH=150 /DNA_ID=CAMNT_0042983775 /DNA_START=279 /DNA_END=731 /DNA_ORIENTATION=-